ncbi:MAG: endonuclease/exonuclease/phosphatase family protein [Candidatus Kaiserbacteria bacterium]|nr:endonuclease/exonuclease/phosphatase family protein [Candidatus Kaiserbacteria bacterium]
MKIYSWNIEFRNRELDRAFEFIAHSDFDIFCLQEVPEKFLEQLKTLPFYIVSAPDVSQRFKGTVSTESLVILSRYPMQNTITHTLPSHTFLPSARGRLFSRCMYTIGLWSTWLGNRHWIETTVTVPELGTITICNLRLPLMNIAGRTEEFETILAARNKNYPTTICGDFNILEALHITTLNWLLGGRVRDMLFYRRERNHFEKLFVENKLTNALHGKVTHPLSQSQLDHILISNSFSMKNARVIPNRFGSDHHPIRAEIS